MESEIGKRIQDLQHENAEVRWGAAAALAEDADAGVDLSAAVPALTDALQDAEGAVRFKAAYALVSIAEHGGDITPAIPALAGALADESEDLRRETVWALYCLAYEGRDIDAAAAALVGCLKDSNRSVRGNGAIGLTLHYLNTGRVQEAQELLEYGDGAVQFGAAWGHTDHYRKQQAKAELQALIRRIRPGILDVSIRDGLVGSLDWARERGEDISFALSVIYELLADAKDSLEQAPLYGILMKLDRRD